MAAGFVARLQIGRRWRNLVVIALVVGVVGGIATSLIAGSRRSSSVVRRYFDATIPYDLMVGAFVNGPAPNSVLPRAEVLKIPGVVRADPDVYFASTLVEADGSLGDGVNSVVYDRESIDPTFRILAGSVPDAADASAVIVNESFVKQFGLTAGDHLTVRAYAERDRPALRAQRYEPHGPQYRFRIAAVFRSPLDIASDEQRTVRGSDYGNISGMFVPASFYDTNRKDFVAFADGYDVQLDSPRRRAAFEAAVDRLATANKTGTYFGPARFAERPASFRTPVGLETTALLALGIAAAIAAAVVTGMLLRAERRAHERDAVLLRALGSTRGQLGAAAILRTAPFALAGALLAVAIAIGLSGNFPVGVGHLLELDRGLDLNLAVLAIAAVTTVAIPTALAFGFELRARSPRDTRVARGRAGIDRILARNGAPAELVIGAHLAFDRGDAAQGAPTRPVIAGGAVALAVVVGLGVMLAGGDRLYASDTAHGWPWDAVIGNTNFSLSTAREAKLVADNRLTVATRARYGQATVGRVSTEVLAYDPGGDAPPVMLSGRLPRAADEIAPGAKLLSELHAREGDKVKLSLADGEFQADAPPKDLMLTVVGVSIPPILGESEFGEGAVVPLATIRAAGGITDPQLVLARLRGRDLRATAKSIERDYIPDIVLDTVPSRIVNLHRVRTLPILGLLLAATLGTILLAYTLAVTARIRVRQLGVLRALGMTPRRVGRVLVWQGVMLAIAIILIGTPFGLVLGSVVWRLIADSFGVQARPIIPSSIALLAPASIIVAIAASLAPARRARRADVSRLLRAE